MTMAIIDETEMKNYTIVQTLETVGFVRVNLLLMALQPDNCGTGGQFDT